MIIDNLLYILDVVLEKEDVFFPSFLHSGIRQVIGNCNSLSKTHVIKIHKAIFKYAFIKKDCFENPLIKNVLSFLEEMPCTSDETKPQSSVILNEIVQSDEVCVPSGSVSSDEVVQTGGGNFIKIISKDFKHFKHFKMDGIRMVFQLKDSSHQDINNLIDWLENAFSEMLGEIMSNSTEDSKIALSISIPKRPEIKPIWVSLRPASELNGKLIVNLISDVNQSNSLFFSDEVLQVEANIINFPHGGAKYGDISNEIEYIKNKRSIKNVSKKGFECLPKSICFVMEKCNNLISECKLSKLSKALCYNASVKVNENKGCSIQDLFKFQKYLKEFQIVVFNSLKGDIIFQGPPQFDISKKNYLYFSDIEKHFYVVKSPTGFFNKKYICVYCDCLYDNKFYHKCEMRCQYCYNSPPCTFVSSVKTCNSCNRSFRGDACYNYHFKNLIGNSSVCETLQVCQNCTKFLDFSKREKNHICGEFFCTNCFKHVPDDHLCYMKLYKKKKNSSYFIIFFDCESTQNVRHNEQSSSFIHTVNLIVAQQSCNKCSSDIFGSIKNCVQCGQIEHIFKYEPNQPNVVKRFIDYCFQHRPFATQIICIAHNLQGYDGHFIISELMDRKKKVEPIMNGFKIMKITCEKVIFIDSLNFLPFSLSKLPKIFGISNVKKGFYPHFFNTLENWNYVGKYPSEDMYGIDTFKEEEKEKFLKWYEVESTKSFNNQLELLNYCKNDVNILRISCLTFMNDFLKMTEVNPFTEALTIASAVMLVYRKNFLKKNLLGIAPKGGYIKNSNHSLIAIKWLFLKNKEVKGKIQHFQNYGEVKLPECNIKVDGYNSETNTVYEFFGCYYHGCILCFQKRTSRKFQVESLDHRYESTCKRIELIKRMGYKIIFIWECQFNKFLKENPEINNILNKETGNIVLPLNPRDAITGGRTELFACYYEAKDDEQIKYLDFTSLYPYVNKYAPYPIGHPRIYKNDDIPDWQEVIKMHGFIKCQILPPQKLNIPVLPLKINNKLYFSLCRTCSETNSVNKCNHSESERMLFGTWVIPEVFLSTKYGYTIKNIYEVWKYDFTQYDPKTKEGGLFSEYVNTFLKLKQEASGWPEDCYTEEEKSNYIQLYKERENIDLDRSKIQKNAGQRHEAKLCLNSLWGKFAQRDDKTRTVVVNNFKELSEYINCPGIELSSIYVINDNTLWINWKHSKEDLNTLNHLNIPIAAYTTSYARMKLYEVLSKIPNQILYCDTDSIIFVEKASQPTFETSNFLGGLTNELESYGSDAYISEFVSIGPKSYSLKIKCSDKYEYITKCKGISINFKNSLLINFEKMKKMIFEEVDPIQIENKRKIKRKVPGTVVSEPEVKKLRFTFDKRVIKKDGFSYPYGFT